MTMKTIQNRKPVAVIISDVHYSLSTFPIADKAFRMAIDKASQLKVPLIDAGDLTNDKALLRAEYVNALIKTMEYANQSGVRVYLLVGNHSLIHEKGQENAINFLAPYSTVISTPMSLLGLGFIPYQTSAEMFMYAIRTFTKGSIIIGHQGTLGGQLGDYIKDHSAINPNDVEDWRVFLGHYHSHYELGTTVSIGNPYTLTFGEAKDEQKGFLVAYSDGTYERVLTNLRKHVIINTDARTLLEEPERIDLPNTGDLVWLKVRGTATELNKLNKKDIGMRLFGTANYKLDKIYTGTAALEVTAESLNDSDLFDRVIDAGNDTSEQKFYLKKLWREIVG